MQPDNARRRYSVRNAERPEAFASGRSRMYLRPRTVMRCSSCKASAKREARSVIDAPARQLASAQRDSSPARLLVHLQELDLEYERRIRTDLAARCTALAICEI